MSCLLVLHKDVAPNYQNTPGTNCVPIYQPPNPVAMGDLPRQVVLQPVAPDSVDTDSTDETESEDVGGMDPDLDQVSEMINAERKRLGYPEFESMEDFYDFISDISEGGPGGPYGSQIPFFYQGGIAQLPVSQG